VKVIDLFRLDGKVAIVTGGSMGLGFWMAEGLAEAGADVALCARDLKQCEEAAKAIAKIGVGSLAFRCDVTQPDEVKAFVDKTLSRFGHIDILINNAGYAWEAPFENLTMDKWNQTMAINVTGTFLCTQEAGKHMIKQRSGKIISITSVAGMRAVDPELANSVHYAASKGAIVAMTRDLARKWCQHNITVNAIAPGYFSTKMAKYLIEHRHAQLMNAIHMKRLGEKDDIKGIAVFLASASSDYITGQILCPDGGVSL
jgi:gluconate 5-dehydrogenase